MSDFYCDTCGEKLEFRFMCRGGEATVCENCNPKLYEFDTAPVDKKEEFAHLTRSVQTFRKKVRAFGVFKCPCGAKGKKLRKVTKKTNECLECGVTYPVYD